MTGRPADPQAAWSSAAEHHGREGMVTVWDEHGGYVGCMGVERWERLLREDTEARSSEPLPCGHPVSAVVQADEGTAYCGACAASSEPVSAEDMHLLIAEAKGLAGLGIDKGYDDLLYKLCDALDECLAALASARGETRMSACECDGSGKISRVIDHSNEPWRDIGNGYQIGGGKTWTSELCACRKDLPPRDGDARWWSSRDETIAQLEFAMFD